MGVSSYGLLHMVAPFVQKDDTVIRNAISASQRLSATLLFLVTRQAFEGLIAATALQTLSGTHLFLMRPSWRQNSI
jgi:hypothetical protein